MRMKKLLILSAAVLGAVACSNTYEVKTAPEKAIGFGTWTETLTKAPKTGFVANDEFDVFGYKWMNGATPAPATVFDGVDVKYDGTNWAYSPARYWDPSYDNYTFFAAYPKDQLATAPAQTGLFVSNVLDFNGTDENLLIAQKTNVAKANYGTTVTLKFKHCGSLVDFKIKKHPDLEKSQLDVTAFSLANINTKGTFTVASYDSSNNPVGAVAGLGWTPDATLNDPAATPYKIASTVSLVANTGIATGTAEDLISNLVVMPQALSAQTFTIAYTITDENGITNTYEPAAVPISQFDNTDVGTDTDNKATITNWMPGVHYIYYITINANSIVFSAEIEPWTTTEITGHYYLIN